MAESVKKRKDLPRVGPPITSGRSPLRQQLLNRIKAGLQDPPDGPVQVQLPLRPDSGHGATTKKWRTLQRLVPKISFTVRAGSLASQVAEPEQA